jgi:diguanylate cyclase (GGDEF)-like protein
MIRLAKKNSDRRIMIVDDDINVVEVVELCLNGEEFQTKTFYSAENLMENLDEWKPDLLLLDINMPKFNGIDALKLIRQRHDYISTILISGNNGTDEVVHGLDAGADDYITKPFDLDELLARVRTQIRIKDLNDQLVKANEKLKELVDIDDLTGLFNMRSLYSRLEYEIARGKRYNRTVCVIMMDMDKFKSVNDGHDHLFGSFVLSEVGKLIHNSIRNVDIAARYGGDEFLMVLTEVDRQGAYVFCERLRQKIENYLFKNGPDEMHLTSSIGFAITNSQQPDIDAKQLVRVADWALYDAKRSGRNRVCLYDLTEHPEFMIPHHEKKAL